MNTTLCFDELRRLFDAECERLLALKYEDATLNDQSVLMTLVYQWVKNRGLLQMAPRLLALSAPGNKSPLSLGVYGSGAAWCFMAPASKLKAKLDEAKRLVAKAIDEDKIVYRANIVESIDRMQEELACFDARHAGY
jgi:hypothetical protein